MKVRNKRGQFFLLAAVIICAIIIGLGWEKVNEATISGSSKELSDYTYNVKSETGAVIDYSIYSGFDSGDNLDDFVNLLSEDIRDKYPNLNFLFIYGDLSNLTIKNYGSEPVYDSEGDLIAGGGYKIESTVKEGGFIVTPVEHYDDFEEANWYKEYTGLDEDSVVNVTIQDNEFSFEVNDYKQVIFIVQKEEKDESYIEIK